MKPKVIASLVVLAACLGGVVASQPAASQAKRQVSSSNKLNSLLAERRDTLRQLVEWVVAQRKNGAATLDNVIRAKNDLLDAELDIVKSKPARIRIRQQQVENLRSFENAMMIRHEGGEISSSELLAAKAARLKAEIQLVRE